MYDLGGGTFDMTVVELAERRVAVVSIDGDHELGGADWDEKLAVHLSHALPRPTRTPRTRSTTAPARRR